MKEFFFVCLRKDLATKFLYFKDMFTEVPRLNLNFKEKPITFKEVEDTSKGDDPEVRDSYRFLWIKCQPGHNFGTVHEKGHYFGENKLSFDKVPNTIIANSHGSFHWHPTKLRSCTDLEYCRIGSYPVDYNFLDNKPKYLIGMSVPPVMVAQIANNIFNQWLNEI